MAISVEKYVVKHNRDDRQDALVVAYFDGNSLNRDSCGGCLDAIDFIDAQANPELFGTYSRYYLAKAFTKYKRNKMGDLQLKKDLENSEYSNA